MLARQTLIDSVRTTVTARPDGAWPPGSRDAASQPRVAPPCTAGPSDGASGEV